MSYDLELFLAVGHLVLERHGKMVFNLDRDLFGDLKDYLCFDLLLDLRSVYNISSSFQKS